MTRATQQRERHRRHWSQIARTLGAIGTALAAVLLVAPTAQAQGVAEAGPDALPVASKIELAARSAAGVPMARWQSVVGSPAPGARDAGRAAVQEGPTQAEVLWKSAVHYLYSGERMAAYREFRKAADAAVDAGDVYMAARANLRAAYVASDLDNPGDARKAMMRVRELRDSPKLTDSERRRLDVQIRRGDIT